MHCNHCNGNIVGDKCLQCGRPVKKEFVYTKITLEQNTREHTTKAGSRTGICCNCLRTMHLMAHELCGACTTAVYHMRYGHHINLKYGTPRYNAALIEYREKRWPEKFRGGEIIENNLITIKEKAA
jgi:hypothetical protein